VALRNALYTKSYVARDWARTSALAEPEFDSELVDIATNALRRAISGNLQTPGREGIAEILIYRRKEP
jgi:hypothetical protein